MSNKLVIVFDFEGIHGLDSKNYKSLIKGTQEYYLVKKNVIKELNLILSYASKYGYAKFLLYDVHDMGHNIVNKDFFINVSIVHHYNDIDIAEWYGADSFLIGFHPRAKTQGFMAHTFTNLIDEICLDDKVVGEVELFDALLTEFGINVRLISGCKTTVLQAESNIPGIKSVVVKEFIKNNEVLYSFDKISKLYDAVIFYISLEVPLKRDVTKKKRKVKIVPTNIYDTCLFNRFEHLTCDSIEVIDKSIKTIFDQIYAVCKLLYKDLAIHLDDKDNFVNNYHSYMVEHYDEFVENSYIKIFMITPWLKMKKDMLREIFNVIDQHRCKF